MDATSQLETEQKYDAGPDFELPDLSGLPGYTVTEPETFHMTAIYFDTDGQDAPGDPLVWHEVEVELMSGPPDVLTAAGKVLRAAGAQPSASASKLGRVMEHG